MHRRGDASRSDDRVTAAQANMYSNGGQNHPFGIVNDTVLTNANLDGLSNAQHAFVLTDSIPLGASGQLRQPPTSGSNSNSAHRVA